MPETASKKVIPGRELELAEEDCESMTCSRSARKSSADHESPVQAIFGFIPSMMNVIV